MPKILFTGPARRAPNTAAAAGVVCAGVCASLWLAAGFTDEPTPAAARRPPAPMTAPLPAAQPRAASAAAPVDGALPPTAAALFERASQLQFCQAQTTEAGLAAQDTGWAYDLDPTGALAVEQDQARRHVDALCRAAGLADDAHIDGLLLAASRQGHRDAALQLLERQVDVALRRALANRVPALGTGDDDTAPAPTYRAEDAALARQVEALAWAGSPTAAEDWARLLDAGLLLPRDDPEAAAWRLASRLAADDASNAEALLAGTGAGDRFSADEVRDITARAVAIRARLKAQAPPA